MLPSFPASSDAKGHLRYGWPFWTFSPIFLRTHSSRRRSSSRVRCTAFDVGMYKDVGSSGWSCGFSVWCAARGIWSFTRGRHIQHIHFHDSHPRKALPLSRSMDRPSDDVACGETIFVSGTSDKSSHDGVVFFLAVLILRGRETQVTCTLAPLVLGILSWSPVWKMIDDHRLWMSYSSDCRFLWLLGLWMLRALVFGRWRHPGPRVRRDTVWCYDDRRSSRSFDWYDCQQYHPEPRVRCSPSLLRRVDHSRELQRSRSQDLGWSLSLHGFAGSFATVGDSIVIFSGHKIAKGASFPETANTLALVYNARFTTCIGNNVESYGVNARPVCGEPTIDDSVVVLSFHFLRRGFKASDFHAVNVACE